MEINYSNIYNYNQMNSIKSLYKIDSGKAASANSVSSVYRDAPDYSWNNPRKVNNSSTAAKPGQNTADPQTTEYMKGIKEGATEIMNALQALASGDYSAKGAVAGGSEAAQTAPAEEGAAAAGANEAAAEKDADILGEVDNLTAGLNKILKSIYANSGPVQSAAGSGAERLYNEVMGAIKAYQPALEKVGISMGGDGYLQVNKDQLAESLKSGGLEEMFAKESGKSYGFASAIARTAGRINSNPGAYAPKAESAKNAGADISGLFEQGSDAQVAAFGNYFGYLKATNTYSNVGGLLNMLV